MAVLVHHTKKPQHYTISLADNRLGNKKKGERRSDMEEVIRLD